MAETPRDLAHSVLIQSLTAADNDALAEALKDLPDIRMFDYAHHYDTTSTSQSSNANPFSADEDPTEPLENRTLDSNDVAWGPQRNPEEGDSRASSGSKRMASHGKSNLDWAPLFERFETALNEGPVILVKEVLRATSTILQCSQSAPKAYTSYASLLKIIETSWDLEILELACDALLLAMEPAKRMTLAEKCLRIGNQWGDGWDLSLLDLSRVENGPPSEDPKTQYNTMVTRLRSSESSSQLRLRLLSAQANQSATHRQLLCSIRVKALQIMFFAHAIHQRQEGRDDMDSGLLRRHCSPVGYVERNPSFVQQLMAFLRASPDGFERSLSATVNLFRYMDCKSVRPQMVMSQQNCGTAAMYRILRESLVSVPPRTQLDLMDAWLQLLFSCLVRKNDTTQELVHSVISELLNFIASAEHISLFPNLCRVCKILGVIVTNANQNVFQLLRDRNFLEILVTRLVKEIEHLNNMDPISDPPSQREQLGAYWATVAGVYKRQALLRQIIEVTTMSTQNGNGFPGIVSSQVQEPLHNATKQLLRDPNKFGYTAYGGAVSFLTHVFGDDPSCIPQMIENEIIPILIASMASVNPEVIRTAPMVLATISLHEKGEPELQKAPFDNLVLSLVDISMVSVWSQPDIASRMGGAIDEILRNRPGMVVKVLNLIQHLLTVLVQNGINFPKWSIDMPKPSKDTTNEVFFVDMLANVGSFLEAVLVNPEISPRIALDTNSVEIFLRLVTSPCLPPCVLSVVQNHPIGTVMRPLTRQSLLDRVLISKVDEATKLLCILGTWDMTEMRDAIVQAISTVDAVLHLYMPVYQKDISAPQLAQLWALAKAMVPLTHFLVLHYAKSYPDRKEPINVDASTYSGQLTAAYCYGGDDDERSPLPVQADIVQRVMQTWKSFFALIGRVTNTPSRRQRSHGPEGRQLVVYIAKVLKDLYARDFDDEGDGPGVILRYYHGLNELTTSALFDGSEKNDAMRPLTVDALYKLGGMRSIAKAVSYNIDILRNMDKHPTDIQLASGVSMDSFLQLLEKLTNAKKMYAASITGPLSRANTEDSETNTLVKKLHKFNPAQLLSSLQINVARMLGSLWENPEMLSFLPALSVQALIHIFKHLLKSKTGTSNVNNTQRWLVAAEQPSAFSLESQTSIADTIRVGLTEDWNIPARLESVRQAQSNIQTPPPGPDAGQQQQQQQQQPQQAPPQSGSPTEMNAMFGWENMIVDYAEDSELEETIRQFTQNVVQRIEHVGASFGQRSWVELADFVLILCQCTSLRFDPSMEDLPFSEANLAMIVKQLSTRLSSLHAVYQDPGHEIYKETVLHGDAIRGSFGPQLGGPFENKTKQTEDMNAVGVLTCCFAYLLNKCFDLTIKHLSLQTLPVDNEEEATSNPMSNMLAALNTFLTNINANASTSFVDRGFTLGLGHLALPSNCFSVLRAAPSWIVSVCVCAQLIIQSYGPTFNEAEAPSSKIQKALVTNCLDLLVHFPGLDADTALAIVQLLHSLCMFHSNAVHLVHYDAAPYYLLNTVVCSNADNVNGANGQHNAQSNGGNMHNNDGTKRQDTKESNIEHFHGGGLGVLLKISKHGKFNGMLKLVTDICCFTMENDAEMVHQIEQNILSGFKEMEESPHRLNSAKKSIAIKDMLRRLWGNSFGNPNTRRVPQRLLEEAIRNVCSSTSTAANGGELKSVSLLPEKDRTRRRRSPSMSEDDFMGPTILNFFFDHLHAIMHFTTQEEDASPLALGVDSVLYILAHLISKYPSLAMYFSKPEPATQKSTELQVSKSAQLGPGGTYIPLPPYTPTASFHFILRRVIPQLSLVQGSPSLTEYKRLDETQSTVSSRSLKCIIQMLVAASHSRVEFRKRLLQEVAIMLKRVDPKGTTSSPPKIRKVEQNPERFFSNIIAWTQLLSSLLLFKKPCTNMWPLLRSSLTQLIDSMDLRHAAAPQACSGIMTVLELLTRPELPPKEEGAEGQENQEGGSGDAITMGTNEDDNDVDVQLISVGDLANTASSHSDSDSEFDDIMVNELHNDVLESYDGEIDFNVGNHTADMELDEPEEDGHDFNDIGVQMDLDGGEEDEEEEDDVFEFVENEDMDLELEAGEPIDDGEYGGYDGEEEEEEEEEEYAPEWTSDFGIEVPRPFGDSGVLRRAIEDGVQIYVAQEDGQVIHHRAGGPNEDIFEGDFGPDLETPQQHPYLNPTGTTVPARNWTSLLNVLGLPPRMVTADQWRQEQGNAAPDATLDDLTSRMQVSLRGALRAPEVGEIAPTRNEEATDGINNGSGENIATEEQRQSSQAQEISASTAAGNNLGQQDAAGAQNTSGGGITADISVEVEIEQEDLPMDVDMDNNNMQTQAGGNSAAESAQRSALAQAQAAFTRGLGDDVSAVVNAIHAAIQASDQQVGNDGGGAAHTLSSAQQLSATTAAVHQALAALAQSSQQQQQQQQQLEEQHLQQLQHSQEQLQQLREQEHQHLQHHLQEQQQELLLEQQRLMAQQLVLQEQHQQLGHQLQQQHQQQSTQSSVTPPTTERVGTPVNQNEGPTTTNPAPMEGTNEVDNANANTAAAPGGTSGSQTGTGERGAPSGNAGEDPSLATPSEPVETPRFFDIPTLSVTSMSLSIPQHRLLTIINVDPSFLEALPPDLQHDVCVQAMQQAGGVATLRNHPEVRAIQGENARNAALSVNQAGGNGAHGNAGTASSGDAGADGNDAQGRTGGTGGAGTLAAAPSDLGADGEISQDVLDALPPDIRAEVLLQQHRTNQANRSQEATNNAPGGVAAGPAEMDNASFFATLTPELRQEMLMTASDVVLQQLPPEMVAEAHVLRARGMNRRANAENQRWVQRSGMRVTRVLERGMRTLVTPGAHHHHHHHHHHRHHHRHMHIPNQSLLTTAGLSRRGTTLGDRFLHPLEDMRLRQPPSMSKQSILNALRRCSQPLVSVQELMQLCKLLYLQGQHHHDQFYNTSIAKTSLAGFFFNVSFSPACLRPLLKRLLHIAIETPRSITWDDGENPAVSSFALANGRALEILVDIVSRIPCRQYFTISINSLATILNSRLSESSPHTVLALRCMKVLLCEDKEEVYGQFFHTPPSNNLGGGNNSNSNTQAPQQTASTSNTAAGGGATLQPPSIAPPNPPEEHVPVLPVTQAPGAGTPGTNDSEGTPSGAAPSTLLGGGGGGLNLPSHAGGDATNQPSAASTARVLEGGETSGEGAAAAVSSQAQLGGASGTSSTPSGEEKDKAKDKDNNKDTKDKDKDNNKEKEKEKVSASALRTALHRNTVSALVNYLCNAPTQDHDKGVQLCTDIVSSLFQHNPLPVSHASSSSSPAAIEGGDGRKKSGNNNVGSSPGAAGAGAGNTQSGFFDQASASANSSPTFSYMGGSNANAAMNMANMGGDSTPHHALQASNSSSGSQMKDNSNHHKHKETGVEAGERLKSWIREDLLKNARQFVEKVSSSIHEDGLPHAALFLRLLHTLRHVFRENDRVGCGPRLQEFLESAHAENLWSSLDMSLADKRTADDWSHHMPLVEAFFIVHNFESPPGDESKGAHDGHDEIVGEDLVYSPRRDRLKSFCARHAKSINHIVKQTPLLLTTSLQAVVKFSPNILDFSNKRNLFRQRLRAYRGDARYETIRLHVRRSDIFIDSYHQLRHRSAEEMRGKLAVQFVGEDGMDAGGLTREWFETLAKEMFNPNYALFAPAGGRPSTFHPNQLSYVNPDHLSFFGFVGRVVGKAVHDNHTLKAYFTMSLYKNLLKRKVQPQDLEALDPEYFKSIQWLMNPGATKELELTFSTETDTFGCHQIIDLKPDGRSIPVDEDNKHEYIQLMCEHKMIHSVKQQLDTFMKGFHELIPTELINIFDDKELELLICGLPEINLADLRRNTEYHNYTEQSPQIKWFWKFLAEFNEEQKAWLLQFVTGTSQVPLEGFKALVGMRGPQKFSIHRAGGSTERLPTAHTCFNQLDLPEYSTEEIFQQKLMQAIEEAHEGFGFI